ncbi:la domain-containing, putative [Babesia ovis]|uniref:La domain-containing, putative n=1 Tax=Babesia ovis TaxID=5869 RepID=A0A9W5T8V0_BABOV|nr:la domain-containing, putative [Babesia ovis]
MTEAEAPKRPLSHSEDEVIDVKKRMVGEPSGEVEVLLGKPRVTDEEFKVILSKATPAQRLRFIQRQISHYLSDENLSRDNFYHQKFQEASSREGIEHVMELKYILSAKRMLDIKATPEDVKEVLSTHPLNGISIEEISGTLYVKKTNGLPRYEGRKLFEKKKKFGETQETYHAAGPILFISNIPSTVKEWQQVKDAIQENQQVRVRFISPVSDSGCCFAWVCKSPESMSAVKNLSPVLEGTTLKVSLVDSDDKYKEFITTLKPSILNSRNKDLQRVHSEIISSPLDINGVLVRNFGSLRPLFNGLLESCDNGTKIALDSQAGILLQFVLDFHPRKSEKLCKSQRSLCGFEVAMGTFKEGSKKKCFMVVTKDNSTGQEYKEDFSISKCLESLRLMAHTIPKTDKRDFVKSLSFTTQ